MPDQQKVSLPAVQTGDARLVTYQPLGDSDIVELKIEHVRSYLSRPTKRGVEPTKADVVKFMMLCKSRALNPWTGDAFLVGFDGREGPEFNLLTSVHALHKRAEQNPSYDGLESGTITLGDAKSTELIYRDGGLVMQHEVLFGAWAHVYRKDRSHPFKHFVMFSAYDKRRSRWGDDPAGMIVKCAEAGALRKAFASTTSGLYIHEEFDSNVVEMNTFDGKPPVDEPEAVDVQADPAEQSVKLAEKVKKKRRKKKVKKEEEPEAVKDEGYDFNEESLNDDTVVDSLEYQEAATLLADSISSEDVDDAVRFIRRKGTLDAAELTKMIASGEHRKRELDAAPEQGSLIE